MSVPEINITGWMPPDLRSNMQTALGAWRNASREASVSRIEPAKTLARLNAALGGGFNILGAKGRARVRSRLASALDGQLVSLRLMRATRNLCGVGGAYFTVSSGTLEAHLLNMWQRANAAHDWQVRRAGKLTKHAAARLVQRLRREVSFADVAVSAVAVCLVLNSSKEYTGFDTKVVPVPVEGEGVTAIVGVDDGNVITFLLDEELGPRRREFVGHYCATLSALPISEKADELDHYQRVRAELLKEGARIWEETREHGRREEALSEAA